SADVAAVSVLPVSLGTLQTILGFGAGGLLGVGLGSVGSGVGEGVCVVVLGASSGTTVHVFVAGVGSTSPWGLTARAAKVCVPAPTWSDTGLVHGANEPPSSWHSNVAAALAESARRNVNVAAVSDVGSCGAAAIAVSGGTSASIARETSSRPPVTVLLASDASGVVVDNSAWRTSLTVAVGLSENSRAAARVRGGAAMEVPSSSL